MVSFLPTNRPEGKFLQMSDMGLKLIQAVGLITRFKWMMNSMKKASWGMGLCRLMS
jgi:hypothetical protein